MRNLYLNKNISEHVLKDGRLVSVIKSGGKTIAWKRYTAGTVQMLQAQYIKGKNVSGVAQYDMFGKIQSAKLHSCTKTGHNGMFYNLKKVFLDYKTDKKRILHETIHKRLNKGWQKIYQKSMIKPFNPGVLRDEKKLIAQLTT